MPYISKDERERFRDFIDPLIDELINNKYTPGQVNYIISKLIWSLFDERPSYTKGNELLGILNAVNLEFYRRRLVEYENEKMIESGDLEI